MLWSWKMEEDSKQQSHTHLEWSSVFHLYEQKMLQVLWSWYLFRPSPQQKPAQTTALKMVQHQEEASLSSSSQADSFWPLNAKIIVISCCSIITIFIGVVIVALLPFGSYLCWSSSTRNWSLILSLWACMKNVYIYGCMLDRNNVIIDEGNLKIWFSQMDLFDEFSCDWDYMFLIFLKKKILLPVWAAVPMRRVSSQVPKLSGFLIKISSSVMKVHLLNALRPYWR